MKVTKALSIRQPWLWAILSHRKDIEIRRWNTNYRGFIALHAPKEFDDIGYDQLCSLGLKKMPLRDEYPLGQVLGVARIYDVIKFDDWYHFYEYRKRHLCSAHWYHPSMRGFLLQNVKPVRNPIPLRGRLNIFNVELDLDVE